VETPMSMKYMRTGVNAKLHYICISCISGYCHWCHPKYQSL